MTRKERIDLALSLDVHRSNAGAYVMKQIFDASANKQDINDQIGNMQFELNKDSNPLYRKYINERLKNEKWIKEQIERLTFIMLWDLLSETQPTERDLYEKKGIPNEYIIEQKEVQRIINKYYGHMHTRPVKWSPRSEKLADDPRYFVWSLNGPRLTRPLPEKDGRLKTVGTPLTTKEKWEKEIHVEDFSDPSYVERLFTFRKTVEVMLKTIREKTSIRKQYRWVIDELLHNDYALTMLFQNAAVDVERRWFEKNLKMDSKVKTVYRICRGFSESEAARTVWLYKTFCEEIESRAEYSPFKIDIEKVKANAIEQITLAAVDYANREFRKLPQWLFSNLLENGFEIESKDSAIIQHNLGIFEMLNKENIAAATHFQSALNFWTESGYSLFREIDCWNLCLALERIGKQAIPEIQKSKLFDFLAIKQQSELRFFLIRQFADISFLFGDISASKRWLVRGLTDSAQAEQFFELSLFFEQRVASRDLLGTNVGQTQSAQVNAIRERYCALFGDIGNFVVYVDKKFFLLKEGLDTTVSNLAK